MPYTTKKLSLNEFKAHKIPSEVQAMLGKINGGSLMECHRQLFAATGIWMPELTPIFQKMDALLMTRELPAGVS
jgi:hypothetical protein